jgi:hypothetical protein
MKTDEDEAFEELERNQRHELLYKSGWNTALEMAAARLLHDFKRAFPEDTLNSFAIYLKGMKR